MKYSELSFEGKVNACVDYINGWHETHEYVLDEQITIIEAHRLCMDCENDLEYNEDGSVIDEPRTEEA